MIKTLIYKLNRLFCKTDVIRSANWYWLLMIIPICVISFLIWLFYAGIDYSELKEWSKKPITEINIKDAIALIIIFSFFVKSSCNCSGDK